VSGKGFPKRCRVKKESEFKRIIEGGIKKRRRNLILYRLKEGEEEGQRFGIKVSGGHLKSVERNRIKREIREVLRKNRDRFAKNESAVVVCRPSTLKQDRGKLREDLEALISGEWV
jgi:ribonuclease P protein component